MSTWLAPVSEDPRALATAEAYGAVFRMMVGAAEAGEIGRLEYYDAQWSDTLSDAGFDRFDDLGDVLAAEHSSLIEGAGTRDEEHRRELRDALRVLRAVYRLGLVAHALDTALRLGGSPELRTVAERMAAHFGDAALLTFVTGKAITVAQDRGVWPFLFQPREPDRVIVMSFAPALITAYWSIFIDLPDQTLLPEPWLEEHQVMLRDGLASAWPLTGESSYWDGQAAQVNVTDSAPVGDARRRLAVALQASLEELEQERAMRVRRAPVRPDRRQLFSDRTRQAWLAHRSLGRALRALGAPISAPAAEQSVLVQSVLPKPAFVGEASEVTLESYAEQTGREAARRETAVIAELLDEATEADGRQTSVEHGEQRPLGVRVRDAVRRMRAADYQPSLILAANLYPVWSRLAIESGNVEEDKHSLRAAGVPGDLTRFIRGRIEGAIVISVPGFESVAVFVLDVSKAIAVPSAHPTDDQLKLEVLTRDLASVETELLARRPQLGRDALGKELDERLQHVDVRLSLTVGYTLADRDAVAAVPIDA